MILSANCKINLGLHILERRDDGYHNIETVMYPVMTMCDSIEIVPAICDSFTTSGLVVDCLASDNICLRALNLMRSRYAIPAVAMHLHKVIPFGAGLGGGSADASFLLRGLNELFSLGLSVQTLEGIAGELGSDTPFFINNTPTLCTARGEVMRPINIDLSRYKIEIIKPDVNISTAMAYANVHPNANRTSLASLLGGDVSSWSSSVVNDFEASIAVAHPQIADIKRDMYRRGALYSAMSGSGSAVFGIFPK